MNLASTCLIGAALLFGPCGLTPPAHAQGYVPASRGDAAVEYSREFYLNFGQRCDLQILFDHEFNTEPCPPPDAPWPPASRIHSDRRTDGLNGRFVSRNGYFGGCNSCFGVPKRPFRPFVRPSICNKHTSWIHTHARPRVQQSQRAGKLSLSACCGLCIMLVHQLI